MSIAAALALRTIAADRYELMGKPHIGPLLYVGRHARIATCVEDFAECEICGRVATNAHHLVPKGMGGGSSTIIRNGEVLRSPCIAVCGNGNASGCHREFHEGNIVARWEWDVPEYGEMYDRGELGIPAHSERFWDYGSYALLFADGSLRRYRR